jgi:HEAT repeat protein
MAGKAAIPALRRVQQDPKATDLLRTAAADALKEIGPPLSEIAAGLDGPPQARERAFGGLWMAVRAMGEYAAEVIPPLRKALKDPDPRVRARAASILGDFAIPRDPAAWETTSPDSALGLFRAAVRDTMPDLIAALRDPDATVRANAADAFRVLLRSQQAGAPSQAAVQALIAALQDDADPAVRGNALMALGETAFDRRLAAEDTDEGRLVMAAIRRAAQDPSPQVASRSADWVNYAQAAFRIKEGR